MSHEFDPGRPIYAQLLEILTQAIAAGAYAPGQRLPGVRELAVQYGVNPNTVQRTMAEMERQGLVYSERTAGRFVTQDMGSITQKRRELAREKTEVFLKQMGALGFDADSICQMLREMAAGETKGE